MSAHVVGPVDEFPPGTRRVVDLGSRSVGVFNVAGRFFALRNTCPHQGAPLCLGRVGGTMAASAPGEYVPARAGEILVCPWHGWEFDLTTGRSLVDPDRVRVRAYAVTVEDGSVVVHG